MTEYKRIIPKGSERAKQEDRERERKKRKRGRERRKMNIRQSREH